MDFARRVSVACRTADLDAPARAVLRALAERADESGRVCEFLETIAADTDLGESTVRRHVGRLRELGILESGRRFEYAIHPNRIPLRASAPALGASARELTRSEPVSAPALGASARELTRSEPVSAPALGASGGALGASAPQIDPDRDQIDRSICGPNLPRLRRGTDVGPPPGPPDLARVRELGLTARDLEALALWVTRRPARDRWWTGDRLRWRVLLSGKGDWSTRLEEGRALLESERVPAVPAICRVHGWTTSRDGPCPDCARANDPVERHWAELDPATQAVHEAAAAERWSDLGDHPQLAMLRRQTAVELAWDARDDVEFTAPAPPQ